MEQILFIVASFGAIILSFFVIFYRQKETKKPLTLKKIVIPPLMMSTGALMFLFPYFRLSFIEIGEAIIVGFIFSIVLLITTKYEVKDNQFYMKPSKWFPVILLGLLIIRTTLKTVLSYSISPGEIGGMFYLLAFVMIIVWRGSMLIKYLQFKKQVSN